MATTIATIPILDRLFPREASNTNYVGSQIPVYVLIPLTIATIGRSLAHIFLKDGGAQSIATIPLDTYDPPQAGQAVISIFAVWGLSQLLIGMLYAIILWRYRAFIPLAYLSMLIEYLGRYGISFYKPLETIKPPPGKIGNLPMIIVASIMLFLSLTTTTRSNGNTIKQRKD